MDFKQRLHIKSLELRVFGEQQVTDFSNTEAAIYIDRLKALLLEDDWTFPISPEDVYEKNL